MFIVKSNTELVALAAALRAFANYVSTVQASAEAACVVSQADKLRSLIGYNHVRELELDGFSETEQEICLHIDSVKFLRNNFMHLYYTTDLLTHALENPTEFSSEDVYWHLERWYTWADMLTLEVKRLFSEKDFVDQAPADIKSFESLNYIDRVTGPVKSWRLSASPFTLPNKLSKQSVYALTGYSAGNWYVFERDNPLFPSATVLGNRTTYSTKSVFSYLWDLHVATQRVNRVQQGCFAVNSVVHDLEAEPYIKWRQSLLRRLPATQIPFHLK